ncbi:MAG: P-II family nitrogen regulator [Bacteroidales bacterium]|nr:P-II family nitrogen regulator [Bacteroidales bacterium]
MKKIEAIIRKTKYEEVKQALHEIGIDFFSYWEVRGVGKATQERIYRGIKYDTSTIERILISIYVRDKFLQSTVDTLLTVARTGEIGDGKIFISECLNAYRIRTGEDGDEVLFIKGEQE